jgi:uncharacterized membrane protein
MRVLLVGESWASVALHQKGFSSYVTSGYEEGAAPLIAALESFAELRYLRNHEAGQLPNRAEDLAAYDAILFSDVGADTLLLHPETMQSKIRPNPLRAVEQYVARGGGFAMIGGWMSFGGFAGHGRYHRTPVEEALPVRIAPWDDRVETPEGVRPSATDVGHPILDGIDGEWPRMLGYNRLEAKPGAQVLLQIADDPFLIVGRHGDGRALAYASDCSPHWGPPEYLAWPHYQRLWRQIVSWLAGK